MNKIKAEREEKQKGKDRGNKGRLWKLINPEIGSKKG
jgi:hypothetical protein